MHGIQAWVGLPQEDEDCEPAFRHVEDRRPSDVSVRRACGRASSRAKRTARRPRFPCSRRSSTCIGRWRRGTRADLEARYPERAAYVAQGSVDVDGRTFDAGQLLVFAPGAPVDFTAVTPAIVMLLGGEPIGERFIEWNFVSSSRARIDQAKADWRAGRMKLPVHDDTEFVPLPPDPA